MPATQRAHTVLLDCTLHSALSGGVVAQASCPQLHPFSAKPQYGSEARERAFVAAAASWVAADEPGNIEQTDSRRLHMHFLSGGMLDRKT